LLASLTGCSAKSILDRIAPETAQEAKTTFDYLRHGQYDRIEPSVDSSVERGYLYAELTRMAANVPPQEPISVKTVGAYAECETRKGCTTRVSLEYQFPAKWILVEMVVHSQSGRSSITSFYVEPESESLEAVNKFTLQGKTKLQYAILGAAILSLMVMLYALVLCIRAPMKKHKWLWIILILLGAGKVGVNWTTGTVFYHIFWISILPSGISSELYGPWNLSVSLPLGAMLFLIYRNRLRKPDATTPPTNDLTTAVM
jgi:hypothetical protein